MLEAERTQVIRGFLFCFDYKSNYFGPWRVKFIWVGINLGLAGSENFT